MNTNPLAALSALSTAPRVVLVTALIAAPVAVISILLVLVVPVALFGDADRSRRAARTLAVMFTALATLVSFVSGKAPVTTIGQAGRPM